MASWQRFRKFVFMSAILSAFCLMGVASVARVAFAAVDEDDEDMVPSRSGLHVSADRARHRLYPGGRDEQELTVQSGLPLPSRSPEGPTTESESAGDSAHD